jgi:hypothetical protein
MAVDLPTRTTKNPHSAMCNKRPLGRPRRLVPPGESTRQAWHRRRTDEGSNSN